MTDIQFVSKVFAVLGYRIVTKHTADLLIELPKAVELITQGEDVHILCRPTGADNFTRFRDCLEDYDGDPEKVYEYAHRTLGWYVDCTPQPNHEVTLLKNVRRMDEHGNLMRLDDEVRFSNYDLHCLMEEFKSIGITATIKN